MAKYPSLPLFTDAFISDTVHLTAAQTGAYLMLIMTAWRSPDCMLPDDDKLLSRMARMDLRTWKANREAVLAFWSLSDTHKWYQRRLLDERKYVEDKSNKNSDAGKASALKRQQRDSTNVQPKPNVNPTPIPTPTPIDKKDTFFITAWPLFPNVRKGSPANAETAWRKAVKRGNSPESILEAVKKYATSPQGQSEYAKGFAAWLNDDGFNYNYEVFNGTRQITSQQASRGDGGIAGRQNGNGFGGRKSQTQLASEETERIIRERREAWAANGGKNPNQGLFGKPRATEPPSAAMLSDAEKVR